MKENHMCTVLACNNVKIVLLTTRHFNDAIAFTTFQHFSRKIPSSAPTLPARTGAVAYTFMNINPHSTWKKWKPFGSRTKIISQMMEATPGDTPKWDLKYFIFVLHRVCVLLPAISRPFLKKMFGCTDKLRAIIIDSVTWMLLLLLLLLLLFAMISFGFVDENSKSLARRSNKSLAQRSKGNHLFGVKRGYKKNPFHSGGSGCGRLN